MKVPFYPLEFYIRQNENANRSWIKNESMQYIRQWQMYINHVLKEYSLVNTGSLSVEGKNKLNKRISEYRQELFICNSFIDINVVSHV